MVREVKWNLFGSAEDVAAFFWFKNGQEVGIIEEPTACPLATYLKETRNINNASVGDNYTTYTNRKGEIVKLKNPKWVGRFVRTIDVRCGGYIGYDGEEEWDGTVTGVEAYKVLKEVVTHV